MYGYARKQKQRDLRIFIWPHKLICFMENDVNICGNSVSKKGQDATTA